MRATFRSPIATLPLLAVVALCGCTTPDADAGPDAPATVAPSTASSAPSTTPAPSEDDAEDPGTDTSAWLGFETDDGSVAFRHPADWVLDAESVFISPDADRDDVEDPYERWMDSATLTAPNGQEVLQMSDVVDVGGTCGGLTSPIEVLATEPAPTASTASPTSIVAMAIGTEDGRWTFGTGLMPDETIPESGSEGCMAYFISGTSDGAVAMGTHHTLTRGEDPLWTVDSVDDARAYMETGEYATILEILRSVELR